MNVEYIVASLLNPAASYQATKFYHACQKGDIDFVKDYLEKFSTNNLNPNHWEPNENSTPLHAACHSGHEEIVQLLLDHHCDRSQLDGDGCTAYEVAANDEIRQLFVRLTDSDNTYRFQDENVEECYDFIKRPEETTREETTSNDESQPIPKKEQSIKSYRTNSEKKLEVGYATASIVMCQSTLGRFIVDKIYSDQPMAKTSVGKKIQEIIDNQLSDSDDRQIQKAKDLLTYFLRDNSYDHVEHLIRLYTMETNFYRVLKKDPIPLALPTYIILDKMTERFFQGQTYRGAKMDDDEISIYEWAVQNPNTIIQTRNFVSTSMKRSVAEKFATGMTSKTTNETRKSVLFIYNFSEKCNQAINLSRINDKHICLSEFEDEDEVLVLPWTLFQVDQVKKESSSSSSSYTIHLSNILLPQGNMWSTIVWILTHPKGSFERFREHFPENLEEQQKNPKEQPKNTEKQPENQENSEKEPEKPENREQQPENKKKQREYSQKQGQNSEKQAENPKEQTENAEEQAENPEKQSEDPKKQPKNPEKQAENAEK